MVNVGLVVGLVVFIVKNESITTELSYGIKCYNRYNMLKNPFINALLATLYITLVVFVMWNVADMTGDKEETLLIPMAMLSLFVLSAAVMGLLFIYTPAKMFFDNQREEALTFFFKTLGTFACFAIVFVLLLVFL